MGRTPIAYFAYNRPEHTLNSLESLAQNIGASDSELYIFCDAAKRPEHLDGVEIVRKIVRSRKWCKTVHIIENKKNMGCAQSVITGVTQISKEFGNVIVLEDDLILSPYFLEYMNDALRIYESDQQVIQISGHMFPIDFQAETDAIFLPFTTSWGWATWNRAWELFDPTMSGYGRIKANRNLRYKFNIDGSYPYFNILEAQVHNNIDSWAIRWYLSTFLANGLTLYPVKTLVENIGFDGSGTHCPNTSTSHPAVAERHLDRFPRNLRVDRKNLKNIVSYFNAAYKSPSTISSFLKKIYTQVCILCQKTIS